MVQRLKDWDDDQLTDVYGYLEIFYTGPSERALTDTDYRGLHVDKSIMRFGEAGREGLIVKNDIDGMVSRVRVGDGTFQLLKGRFWDGAHFWGADKDAVYAATWHTVFGKEMAEEGRVSMTVYIASRYAS